MNAMKKQPIAIIGGMGPEASSYLYNTLIKQSIDLYNAVNNDDFPEIILYSIPVPDFISSNDKKKEALEMLKERVADLNKLDLLCMCIACNTAYVLLDDLKVSSKIPFVSMIDEVVKEVKKDKIKKVGILGTPSTIASNIYQDALDLIDIESVIPDNNDLKRLERIIRNVIAGSAGNEDTKILREVSNRLKKRGANGIILGCTEIPLVFPTKYSLPVYNSVEILSKALLRKYYNR